MRCFCLITYLTSKRPTFYFNKCFFLHISSGYGPEELVIDWKRSDLTKRMIIYYSLFSQVYLPFLMNSSKSFVMLGHGIRAVITIFPRMNRFSSAQITRDIMKRKLKFGKKAAFSRPHICKDCLFLSSSI